MTAIEVCRTAALGGHLERCDCCNHERPCYDSCGDRHCPKCQSLARAEWVEKRTSEVLPTHYFHVVFTIPEPIAAIAYHNKDLVYGMLFRATAETLSTIAADPQHLGAEIGFFAILHSWGQNLFFHPHLHCVVPGGGISLDGARWISCRPNFFLPVKVLSRLFRRLFLKYLQEAFDAGKLQFFSLLESLLHPQAFTRHLDLVRDVEWVVYAKPPFAGPQQVVDYVGRYTHRVAISNHRIVDIEDGQVKFNWRDYRDNNQQKTMPLTADEFIRRFLLHVLRAASSPLFTDHPRHFMSDRKRIRVALATSSTVSSQRRAVASRRSDHPANSQASRILPHKFPQKTANCNPACSSPHLPTAYAPYVASHLSSKTHSAHTLQRFSPKHF